ncbi:hypothetical protein K469DRAFT_529478, partial [Zopfia rhizophila CBS 207.26]
VRCDCTKLTVTANYYHALTRLRRQTMPRLLWADAICIDQTKESERNHHARLMSRIY